MREIKFRAWDKQGKRMLFDSFKVNPNGTASTFGIYSSVILQQFTGLHDKNGKEIYEGDKITWKCKGSLIIGMIYWGCDSWKIKDEKGGNVTRLGNASSISVIGNIYEDKK